MKENGANLSLSPFPHVCHDCPPHPKKILGMPHNEGGEMSHPAHCSVMPACCSIGHSGTAVNKKRVVLSTEQNVMSGSIRVLDATNKLVAPIKELYVVGQSAT